MDPCALKKKCSIVTPIIIIALANIIIIIIEIV